MADLGTMAFSMEKLEVKPDTRHILVVDDEEAIAGLIESYLKSSGYRVTAFSSGEKALVGLRLNPGNFDLVITDYHMPRLSGIKLAAEIGKLKNEIPVILMSGDCCFILRENAAALGIKGCIAKPFSLADLADAARKVLAGGNYLQDRVGSLE